MSGPLLLQRFTLISPAHEFHQQEVDLLINEGRLTRIETGGTLTPQEGYQIIQGSKNHFVSAGWVDMQCHLSDPGREKVESLTELAQAAVMGGFTHVLGYPNTQPALDSSQMIEAVLARATQLPISLHVCGALTEQIKGTELAELYDMQQAGALAFSDGDHPVTRTGTLLRA
ncbi:MAG: dihydroorotase, partial [Bacteroidota bacterium]